jgi:murein DD-endopeptidase MepM/ murein hydrolase activator NlpD
VLLLIAAVLLLPSTAHARTWRWPVRGPIVERFELKADRFAKGQHRGIEIQTRAGTPVRAACAGAIRFAGTIPRQGRSVSMSCGPFIATYLHLSSMAVRPGQPLAAGERIGTVGAGPLHFGVREAADSHGYVDPLSLLPSDPLGPAPPPLAVAPRERARPIRPSMPARIPTAVWVGLAILGLAIPTLTIVRVRARGHQARRATGRPAQVAIRDARE